MASHYQRQRRGGGPGSSFNQERRLLSHLKRAVINGDLNECRDFLFCHWCSAEDLVELLKTHEVDLGIVEHIRDFLDYQISPISIANHRVDLDIGDTFLITAIRHDHTGSLSASFFFLEVVKNFFFFVVTDRSFCEKSSCTNFFFSKKKENAFEEQQIFFFSLKKFFY